MEGESHAILYHIINQHAISYKISNDIALINKNAYIITLTKVYIKNKSFPEKISLEISTSDATCEAVDKSADSQIF